MDLSIVLWIGGMLFSLGIFAVKVGFGLGFSRMRWKGILITLSMYLVLFVLIAMLSEQLMKMLEPVLKKGPYLHALMAMGMIAWGTYIVRQSGRAADTLSHHHTIALPHYRSAALLLIPCPVCLSAMTFSTWAALNVIRLPAYIVGLGLGTVFIGLSLLFLGITRLKSSMSPRISLGLSMMGIGIYFMASLVLPAKIEEARGMYQSFLTEGANIDMNNSIGVFAILFVGLLIGFLKMSFSGLTRESRTKELDSPIKSGNDKGVGE